MDTDPTSIDLFLGAHLLSPLFTEYERTISALEAELKIVKAELSRKFQLERDLVTENERLASDLEVKTREYVKLIEETRDNIDLLNKGANNKLDIENELELQK